MNAIIQHTFNSGLGDCVVAVSEYLHNANKLKNLGYKIILKINTTNNLYYSNLNLFDLFDINSFDVFDSIEHTQYSVSSIEGFTTKHISYGARNAGLHWWDLFLDTDVKNLEIDIFPQNGYHYSNLPKYNNIKFSNQIYELYNNLNYKEHASLYMRANDCNNSIDLYQHNLTKIVDIYNRENIVFVCSNSYELKDQINNIQTLKIDMPMEKEYGNHIYNNRQINNQNILKNRTLLSCVEMMILANSTKVYFLTSWNRISNFLYYAIINNKEIIYI